MFPLLDSDSEINTHFPSLNFCASVEGLSPSSPNRLGDLSILTTPSTSEKEEVSGLWWLPKNR